MTKDSWYKDGIDFKCQGCGQCCFGFPGYVWLKSEDIDNISLFLNLKPSEFIKKYTRSVYGFYSLKELQAPLYECIFFENKRCKIYPVRPFQCRSFPFWPHNMKSKEHYEENVKSFCIGASAKPSIHYSKELIDQLLTEYKKDLPF